MEQKSTKDFSDAELMQLGYIEREKIDIAQNNYQNVKMELQRRSMEKLKEDNLIPIADGADGDSQ